MDAAYQIKELGNGYTRLFLFFIGVAAMLHLYLENGSDINLTLEKYKIYENGG